MSGKSKRGLGQKGANWAKKGPFGAMSALPPWVWGVELVAIGPEKAPIGPGKALQSVPKRPDFPDFPENLGRKPPLKAPVSISLQGSLRKGSFSGFRKGWFPKGWFCGCSPLPKTGMKVDSNVPPVPNTGTSIHSDVPQYKPPFYETTLRLLFPLDFSLEEPLESLTSLNSLESLVGFSFISLSLGAKSLASFEKGLSLGTFKQGVSKQAVTTFPW